MQHFSEALGLNPQILGVLPKILSLSLTLVPTTVFLRRLPATGGGGKNTPRHISTSRAHSEKIPTATPHAF